jgi:thiamine-phosphate pyrophosphorylase
MARFVEAGLYLVTSQALSAGRSTLRIVDAALAAGVRLIQLREKELPVPALVQLAREVRARTANAGGLLVVNDRLDVAMAVGADGVHLGQDDFPVREARQLAPDLIVGASSHTEDEARRAQAEGASYVNIGPLFPTATKPWSDAFLGIEGLRRIARTISIPFTVMGGIKGHHIRELALAGAKTIAVVTAVTADPDPEAAARGLLREIRGARGDPVAGDRCAGGEAGRDP